MMNDSVDLVSRLAAYSSSGTCKDPALIAEAISWIVVNSARLSNSKDPPGKAVAEKKAFSPSKTKDSEPAASPDGDAWDQVFNTPVGLSSAPARDANGRVVARRPQRTREESLAFRQQILDYFAKDHGPHTPSKLAEKIFSGKPSENNFRDIRNYLTMMFREKSIGRGSLGFYFLPTRETA